MTAQRRTDWDELCDKVIAGEAPPVRVKLLHTDGVMADVVVLHDFLTAKDEELVRVPGGVVFIEPIQLDFGF